MATLAYCKGLPTPKSELNSLGFTELEMFLAAYAPVFHKAACETANYLLSGKQFNKSKWNTHLQTTHGISKRHANGVISFAKGAVDSAALCRANHIKQLTGKLKSIKSWIEKSQKKLKDSKLFYNMKFWVKSKTECRFALSCDIRFKCTNWQKLRLLIHKKKRRASLLIKQIEHLNTSPIQVVIPKNQAFVVGSKDESFGNQVCQWDGNVIKFRVPGCLESKFGKYVESTIGNFDRSINRLPDDGAKTWHFYRKDPKSAGQKLLSGELSEKWCVAVQFTPKPVKRISRHSRYGCIGIDMNPGSIGWAYVDLHGNLRKHGKIPLHMGLPTGKQNVQIVDACLQLAVLAQTYACPVVCEDLDFSAKKEQLTERGAKYSRMLSGWAYSRFYELLKSILSNRGIYLIKVNPAYTSLIGLVKYARQYGLPSDCAAAIAIARRGMRLSENIPGSITAYLDVKSGKHVWSLWNQLNTFVKESRVNRHQFYSISNWESLLKQKALVKDECPVASVSSKDDFLGTYTAEFPLQISVGF